MRILPINENSVMLYFADEANVDITNHIALFEAEVKKHFGHIIQDTIASYTSLFIIFDILQIGLEDFGQKLQELSQNFIPSDISSLSSQLIEIPVYYGEEAALDAKEVSQYTGLDFAEVIRIHQEKIYHVYAIGFSIGFAFLGQTDKQITIPRKSTPRLKIPPKSVGLADNQTAIYPKETPGGWQIIGRTPITLVDFSLKELSIFKVGAQVKFFSISKEEYLKMGGEL
ncbi:MAG: 5-oxoprolinase subunit PxpB [Alphaproteobacteria bacterium]